MLYTHNRWLHPDDPLRAHYGPELPPEPRTHEKACREAKESENSLYAWKSRANHPRYQSGINSWSPLSVLQHFDMIWDFPPDMMHINKTFWERLVVGVYSGARTPTFNKTEPAKPPSNADTTTKQKYAEKLNKFRVRQESYQRETIAFRECTFTEEDRKIVDERVKNLVGFPDWIKSTLVRVM
jgi:hypothetical protein